MRVLRKAAECRVAHEYIRLLARSKKASSRGKTTHLAHAKADFFKDEAMARTGGAGGEKRTVGPSQRFRFQFPRRLLSAACAGQSLP